MKRLFGFCVLLSALATNLPAQTNTTPAPATTAAADTAKPEAPKETDKATAAYPVTAVVSNNTIMFPTLLSKSGTELMTNAVFRRSFGRKVIFAQEFNLRSFDVDALHPSVLAQLNLDADKLKTDQVELDQKNKDWAVQNQQKNQQILAAQAAALSKAQAAQQAASSNSAAGNPTAGGGGSGTHHRKQPPGSAPTPPPPSN
jgi:hypothetical protein